MTGIGIQLALSTNFISNRRHSIIPVDVKIRSRCCWSLFALDRVYGCTLTASPSLSTESMLPEYPSSPSRPVSPGDNITPDPSVNDLGVTAYYLQLLSIWGTTVKYMQEIKDGQSEDPWTLSSRYNHIVSRLFDFETRFAQIHRFQQVRIQEHTIEWLEARRDYYSSWLSGQFLFHAIQGLINHPFIHIASKLRRQNFQPPSFQQNTVDQAVLHSSWILKCIEVCGETGFQIHDPFIAHLAAIIATVYLFLLNAKDDDLATQSRLGFEKCYKYVQSMSNDWPHLRHTVRYLLQVHACC